MGGLNAGEKAAFTRQIATDKKAMDVVVLDMREASSFTDFFLICSGGSERQVQAIADAIDEQLAQSGIRSIGVEGYREGHWILMDYGDVLVHVFSQDMRAFYDLERLWASAPRLDVSHEVINIAPQHGASVV